MNTPLRVLRFQQKLIVKAVYRIVEYPEFLSPRISAASENQIYVSKFWNFN